MGVEEICNTGLSLGLALLESTSTPKNQVDQLDHQHNNKPSSKLSDPFLPSLSLALSSELLTNQGAPPIIDKEASNLKRQGSSLSVVSSTSVKRERDIIVRSGEEEDVLEVENKVVNLSSSKIVSSSDHDQDDVNQEYFGTRKKLRLSKDQSFVLEESFKEHSTLNPKQKQALAKRLNLRPRQVEVWFQNRRARTKLKQTEEDFEMLKKYCETLTEENRRLKKEVQDLKAFNNTTPTAGAPFYMQLSAATVTLCPSCQRISGSTTTTTSTVTESSSKLFPFTSKAPEFYATTLAHASAPSYSSTLHSS